MQSYSIPIAFVRVYVCRIEYGAIECYSIATTLEVYVYPSKRQIHLNVEHTESKANISTIYRYQFVNIIRTNFFHFIFFIIFENLNSHREVSVATAVRRQSNNEYITQSAVHVNFAVVQSAHMRVYAQYSDSITSRNFMNWVVCISVCVRLPRMEHW